jgi:hypothetical protein
MNEAVLTPERPLAATSERPYSALYRLFDAYEWLARREMLACAAILFLTLGIRAALLPWLPVPLPAIHDEFGYLLDADTFASGRVTNAPHPMWRHFETFVELMQPSYSSEYPPLQGLVLAFGQKFFGRPWAGVYLSAGLMCAAVCWMFQGWLTPNLALLGALLFVMRVGILSYWMNSYWGGAVAAIGGALVLGSLPRIWSRAQPAHLTTFALGLAILMHSRPWEGAVLGAAALGVLIWTSRRFTPAVRVRCLRGAVPASAIVLVSLGAVAYVDYRITGDPLVMPHAVYDKQYLMAPLFAFLSLGPEPLFAHHGVGDLYSGENGAFTSIWRDMRRHPFAAVLGKASLIYDFFFGLWPLLIVPLFWPYHLKTIEERATVFLLLVFLGVATFPLTFLNIHYVAPIAGLLYVRFLQTLSRLHGWRPAGRPLGPAVGVFFVTLLGYQFAGNLSQMFHGGLASGPFATARNSVAQELAHMPGRQLVLVRYAPEHNQLEEWIYNRADIDASQTVWARAIDGAEDADLIRYFRDRRTWLLEADKTPLQLVAYPAAP